MKFTKAEHANTSRKALKAWEKAGHEDDFRMNVTGDDGETIHVHISHHETFALGGQTFTVDVRPYQDSEELLCKTKLSLVNGQVTVPS